MQDTSELLDSTTIHVYNIFITAVAYSVSVYKYKPMDGSFSTVYAETVILKIRPINSVKITLLVWDGNRKAVGIIPKDIFS